MAKTLEDQGRALPKNSAKTPMPRVAPAKIEVEILPDGEGDDTLPALDLEPYIDPKTKALSIRGNYDTIEAFLSRRRDFIAGKKFSAKDLETVAKYKKEAVGYRTMIDAAEKNTKKVYFNSPKDVFAGKIASLQSIVGEIEDKADKILAVEEKKRVDALNEVFAIYCDDFQAVYGLSPEGRDSIEYRPNYYNKTAKEKETKADLEEQFKVIKAKEKARASGEKMIRAACAPNKLLDVERYILQLAGGTELATILEDIEAEKERLEKAKEPNEDPRGFRER